MAVLVVTQLSPTRRNSPSTGSAILATAPFRLVPPTGFLRSFFVDRGEAAALRGEVFELPAIQLARRRVFAGDDQHGKILLKPTTVLFLVAM